MRIFIVLALVSLMSQAGFSDKENSIDATAPSAPLMPTASEKTIASEYDSTEYSDLSTTPVQSLSKFDYKVFFSDEETTYKESLSKLPAARLKALKPKVHPKTRDITFSNAQESVTWKDVPRDAGHYLKDAGKAFLSRDGKTALILSQFDKGSRIVMLVYDKDTKSVRELIQDDITTKKRNSWDLPKAVSNNGQFFAFTTGSKLWLVNYALKRGRDATLLQESIHPNNIYFSKDCTQLVAESRFDKPQTFSLLPKQDTPTQYESMRQAINADPSSIE